jgi:NADH-quinone oxidoreductase subunit E
MTTIQPQPSPPGSGDAARPPLPERAMAELAELAARYPQPRSALLPMLHLVQSYEGCVTDSGIEACAEVLQISTADVAGVATFYTMYKRHPVGEYHVGVCTNTLCAVMGGDDIFDRLRDHLDVGHDETTTDGRITLEHVECNAACDYAPVVMVNWEFFDNQTPDSAVGLVDRLRAGDEVTATRGARVCSWREAERVLAGFPDDRADEGPGAGHASLAGLRIARERGWTAPTWEEATAVDSSGTGPGKGEADPGDSSGTAPYRRADQETQVQESPAEVRDDSDRTPSSGEGVSGDSSGKDA